MIEPPKLIPGRPAKISFWDEHRYLLLIIGTIVISLILVVISVVIYNVSGSAQLDLSRPGYQSVSDQVDRSASIEDFSTTGEVTEETINEFIELYDKQADKAKAIDAFNGDPLNPGLLEFTDSSASQ